MNFTRQKRPSHEITDSLHISPYSLAENPLEEKPFTQLDPDHGRRWGRHKSGQNPAGDVAGDEGKREGEHEES
jgi:hypothetical protein